MVLKKTLIQGFEPPKLDQESVKKKLNKISSSKSTTVKKTSAITSKSTSIVDKLKIIREEVQRSLGKYEANTEVITSIERLHEYIDNCIENNIVAIDTETNNSLDPITCKLMGLCIYTPNQKAAYVPVNHVDYVTNELLPDQLTEEQIKSELERIIHTKIIMHNAKFDMRVIKNTCNIFLPCYWDTMFGAKLLNENEIKSGGNYGLKWQYANKVDHDAAVYNIETFFAGIKYEYVDIPTFSLYAATDAYATYKLYLYQESEYNKPENSRLKEVLLNIEMGVLPAVAMMEENGVNIDFEFAKRLSDKYHKKLDAINEKLTNELNSFEAEINSYKMLHPDHKLSDPILISSPSQLATLLYDILKCPIVDKTKPRGTGEEILKKIGIPLCNLILDYREMQKLLTTYIDKLPEAVSAKTKKIHASFNQFGADTGRFSSNDPNLQNIPSHNKEIRMMFVPSPGHVFVGGDFSQQEPRILAHFSQDENMINAYNNKQDLYATVAAKVNNKTYWECMEKWEDGSPNPIGKKLRGQIKGVVLGIMYGRGTASVAEQTGQTLEEAKQTIDGFYDGFPKVRNWIDETNKFAEKNGYVETLCGRRRRLPDILLDQYEVTCFSNKPVSFNPLFEDTSDIKFEDVDKIEEYKRALKEARSFQEKEAIKRRADQESVKIKDNGGFIAQARRQCVNARIQGSAADMSKRAMILIHNNERLNELGFKMLFVVHDEITGECPKENVEEVSKLLSELMIKSAEGMCSVKMKCDTYAVSRWYEDDFSDLVQSEYTSLLKENSDTAWDKIKDKHSEISENRLLEMCNGTYECGEHEDI